MPSRKKKNGEFKDVAHPLNNETRRMIEDKILGEYERILGERGEQMPQAASVVAGDNGVASPPQPSPFQPSQPSQIPAEIAAEIAAAPPLEKTMEEVEEMHLRDSFWTVT
jgi:hypothetical protein